MTPLSQVSRESPIRAEVWATAPAATPRSCRMSSATMPARSFPTPASLKNTAARGTSSANAAELEPPCEPQTTIAPASSGEQYVVLLSSTGFSWSCCGVHDAGEIVTRRSGFHNTFEICEGWPQQWANAAEQADVALVVLGAWDVFDVRLEDRTIRFGTPAYEQLFECQLQKGLDALAFVGAHAALLEIPCMNPVDARGAGVPALPERGDDTRVARLNVILRRMAAADPERVTFIEGPDEWCADEEIAAGSRLSVGRGARVPAWRRPRVRVDWAAILSIPRSYRGIDIPCYRRVT